VSIRQYANGNDETAGPEAHLICGTILKFQGFWGRRINWIRVKIMRMDAGAPLDLQAAQIASAASSYSAAGSVAYMLRLNWNERCASATT